MEFEFIDKAVYFPKLKALAIADLHMGYEEAIKSQGGWFPGGQLKSMLEDLNKIFEILKKDKKAVEEIVILGDLKHEFGKISGQEMAEISELIDYLADKGRVVIIRGNHDKMLEPIAARRGINLVEFYIKEGSCFTHGDKTFKEGLDKKIKRLVMGHMHPAIKLIKDAKEETYKCFLVGKWKGKEVIILPSFFPYIEGSEVDVAETNLAFNMDLRKFEAYVIGDEVYNFGKVGKIKDLNLRV